MGDPQNPFDYQATPEPPLSSASSSSPSYVSEGEDAPPLWRTLTKQLSMREAPRNIAWERRRRQVQQQERWRSEEDLTDEDLNELKGCIELGFGFNAEEGQRLCTTIPALDLYFAVNRQFLTSHLASPLPSPAPAPPATLSPRSCSLEKDSDSWKILNKGDDPQQVKTKLRHWAQAVACSVMQSPIRGCGTSSFFSNSLSKTRDQFMAPDASHALAVREKVQHFLNAAQTGNLDLLKKLAKQLDGGKGLAQTVADVKDANQRGALHFAAREGQAEVCKYLLEELKMDVNTQDEDGDTPLTHAARQGHTALAKYLVDHGADPSIPSALGTTALHHSAGTGDVELLKFLLSKDVSVDSQSDAGTPLIWAAGHGQQDSVKLLLEHKANPDAKTEDDITPLLSAVAAGSLACLELLIKAGATVNFTAGGATPLHIAADIGSPEIINCLLQAGADPNAIDEDGLKPVQVAASRGNKVAVEILLPVTAPIESIPEWSIDGILKHMQQETGKEEGQNKNTARSNGLKDTATPKISLPEVSAEAKKKAAEAKARADDAFKRKDYMAAVDAYTQAIDFDPTDATLLSNRSLCWLRLGQAEHALADARACKALRPDWPKACYREGAALRLLQKFEDAANAFYDGVTLNPENMELVTAFREAVDAGRKFHATQQQQLQES
ncbi:uncharacterized protein LOC125194283 [Salvia hispanica]|uniref:uncharacterized protein LOC125194283 n=1 Tax=Salvia hispanica TaxID=49212 RepID=UPI0020092253|nr:uncharacterized protein LOC125194283 [Salvia hispanica]